MLWHQMQILLYYQTIELFKLFRIISTKSLVLLHHCRMSR